MCLYNKDQRRTSSEDGQRASSSKDLPRRTTPRRTTTRRTASTKKGAR
jgi:hypothetical protein